MIYKNVTIFLRTWGVLYFVAALLTVEIRVGGEKDVTLLLLPVVDRPFGRPFVGGEAFCDEVGGRSDLCARRLLTFSLRHVLFFGFQGFTAHGEGDHLSLLSNIQTNKLTKAQIKLHESSVGKIRLYQGLHD